LLNQDMKPLYSIDRCSFPFSLEIVFITEIHPSYESYYLIRIINFRFSTNLLSPYKFIPLYSV
jgi:hypothetical protein